MASDARRICFGTSTFVAGRLRPTKDSGPGIEALGYALDHGVTTIHSNPNLGTQWAIRRVLSDHPHPVRHLVKAEAPPGTPEDAAAAITERLRRSCRELGVEHVDTAVVELDLHRCPDPAPPALLTGFFQVAASAALDSGLVERAVGYCHGPQELNAAMACPDITGIAGQYSPASPWLRSHLQAIIGTGRTATGMSPFNRGSLIDETSLDPLLRLRALIWATELPSMSRVTVTMSTIKHVAEVLAVTDQARAQGQTPRDVV